MITRLRWWGTLHVIPNWVCVRSYTCLCVCLCVSVSVRGGKFARLHACIYAHVCCACHHVRYILNAPHLGSSRDTLLRAYRLKDLLGPRNGACDLIQFDSIRKYI